MVLERKPALLRLGIPALPVELGLSRQPSGTRLPRSSPCPPRPLPTCPAAVWGLPSPPGWTAQSQNSLEEVLEAPFVLLIFGVPPLIRALPGCSPEMQESPVGRGQSKPFAAFLPSPTGDRRTPGPHYKGDLSVSQKPFALSGQEVGSRSRTGCFIDCLLS